MKRINYTIEKWSEKYISDMSTVRYSDEKIKEIAFNCISLTDVWLTDKNLSYQLVILGQDNEVIDTLDGVNTDNLPYTLMGIITTMSSVAKKVSVMSFKFINGVKETKIVGEMDVIVN